MRKFKGLLYAVIAVATLGCLSGCNFGWKTNYIYENGDKYTAGDRTISEKIETIDVNYMSGDVTLIGTDGDTVTIKETSKKQLSDKQKVHTWVDGTTLYVRFCASAKGLELNNLDKNLEISIPKDMALKVVKADVSSGDVTFQNFESDSVDVHASSGDLNIACAAKNVKLSASSGDVTLTQRGDSDEISLKTSSGKVYADLENAGKLNISVSSGTVTVNANDVKEVKSKVSSGSSEYRFAVAPANTDIDSSSGDVTIYLPEQIDLTAEFSVSSGKTNYDQAFSKNGKQYVCGTGANQMKVHVSSGNVDVKVLDAE